VFKNVLLKIVTIFFFICNFSTAQEGDFITQTYKWFDGTAFAHLRGDSVDSNQNCWIFVKHYWKFSTL